MRLNSDGRNGLSPQCIQINIPFDPYRVIPVNHGIMVDDIVNYGILAAGFLRKGNERKDEQKKWQGIKDFVFHSAFRLDA